MKKIIRLLLLLISLNTYSQISMFERKFTAVNIMADPYASYKEGGINIGGEIEYVGEWGYVKTGVQTFAVLDGGYIDWTNAMGINLKLGYFDHQRIYFGGRGGWIIRGGNPYPTVGVEGGYDYIFDSGFIIGLRSTYDYREDFKYWGGEGEFRPSGFIKIGFKL